MRAHLGVPDRRGRPPVALKDPKDFRIIGRPTPRLDARAKSSGRQDFGIDTRLPGQLSVIKCIATVYGVA